MRAGDRKGCQDRNARRNMRALILDDDPEVRQAMASALQEAGCDQVDMVADPFDAIGLVFRKGYDLVLLDP